MGSYKFDTKPECMKICIGGQFSPEDVNNYTADFQKEIKKVNPATCKLDFDASTLKVFANDSAKMLAVLVQSYKDLGFEDVELNVGNNAIAKMQCKQIGDKVGFKKFKVL